MKPKFFSSPAQFRQWLEQNHDRVSELLVGFHKKSSGMKSITYPEALDEALCFGWIDGVRRNLDETSYTIRFTPRKSRSIWSLVNVNHVERLKKEKRMHAAGLEAYARRDPERTGIYAFENEPRQLSPEYEEIQESLEVLRSDGSVPQKDLYLLDHEREKRRDPAPAP